MTEPTIELPNTQRLVETVMAIDPGITTGVAVRVTVPDGRTYYTVNINPIDDLWGFMVAAQPDVVILEQFAAAGRIDLNCALTLEACGWVKAYVHQATPRPEYVSHTPAYRRAFIKLAKEFLKGLDYRALRTDHEIDATAHLVRWEDDQRQKNDPNHVNSLLPSSKR